MIYFYIYYLYPVILIIFNLANHLDFSFLGEYYVYMSGSEGGSNNIPGEGNIDPGGSNSNPGGNNPNSESQVGDFSIKNKYQCIADALEDNRAKTIEFRINNNIKNLNTSYSDLGINFKGVKSYNFFGHTIREVFPTANGESRVDNFTINTIRNYRSS
jgi:hypothetical protein